MREGEARQSRVVFRECIGTDSTGIKVGVCFFSATKKALSFLSVNLARSDHVTLVQIQASG